jgi:hypothetical protein
MHTEVTIGDVVHDTAGPYEWSLGKAESPGHSGVMNVHPERPDAPCSGLEYDLAHEAEEHARRPCGPASPRTIDLVQVDIRSDYDGDYGYDLAHDVPGRRPPAGRPR